MNAIRKALIGPAAVLVAAAGAVGDPTFHTVVLSGAQAPGLPAGVTFAYLADIRVNQAGRVAFWADLAGPGVTADNSNSLWSDRSGTLELTHRQGDPAPFGANIVWGAFPAPAFNADGRIAFTASLVDPMVPGPVKLGIFAADAAPGSTMVIAREGFQAAGLPPGTNWASLPIAMLGAAGEASFNVGQGKGVWAGGPGMEPTLRAASGSAPPGTPAGHTLAFLDQPVASAGDVLLFRSSTTDGAATPTFQTGLWASANGGLNAVAVQGMQAPGTTAGVTFVELGMEPALAVSGVGDRTAFWARLAGPGVTPANESAIYAGPPGSPSLLARAGDPAPGTAHLFGNLGRHPAAGVGGQVAFLAHLAAAPVGENSGIWVDSGSGLTLAALEGAQAPRLPLGTLFAGFTEPAMNESGQIAFLARLTGPGVTPATSTVLYATDTAGRLRPLVRTGDLFDVGGGATRVVDEILFDSPAAQGGHAGFVTAGGSPSRGLLGFKLVFKDPLLPPSQAFSSGLFTARIRCLPDLSNNGAIQVDDFIHFLNEYQVGNLRQCDFDGSGILNINDFIAFQNAVAAGCP